MVLTSLWLRFPVDRPVEFQSYSGFASRGIFFDVLKQHDDDLATYLHSGGDIAPYSTTPILADSGGRLKIVYKRLPACVASLRICVLEYELSKVFLEAVVSGPPRIRLVDREVPLTGVSVGVVDFSEFLREARPVRRFSICFRTPCFFRATPPSIEVPLGLKRRIRLPLGLKRFVPLPEPILMFKNLVRLWRAFSRKPFSYSGFLRWIELGGVAISGFPGGIRTVRVYEHPDSNKWAVGFVGTVNFSLPDDLYSKRYARIADALLKFAEHSNVGGNRTAGFGVIDYRPVEYLEE